MNTVYLTTLALAILAALLCLCSPSSSLPTTTLTNDDDSHSQDINGEAALMRAMHLDPTSDCEGAIVELLMTINESASAGLQFMFANGRGISDLGEYSSCQSIPGCNYWVVYIKYQQLPFNMTLNSFLGVCMPSKCSADDKPTTLTVLKNIWGLSQITNVTDIRALPEDKGVLDPGAIAMIIIIVLLFICNVISTVQGRLWEKQKNSDPAKKPLVGSSSTITTSTAATASAASASAAAAATTSMKVNAGRSGSISSMGSRISSYDISRASQIIQCWNAQNIWHGIFHKVPESVMESPRRFPVVDLFKVTALAWAIFGYTGLYMLDSGHDKTFFERELRLQYAFQFVLNAGLAADIFLFSSGFLAMYLCLTKLHKVSGMERVGPALRWVFSMYVQRYLRLLPVVVFCLGYVLWLLPYNGKGPMWEMGLERSERATCFKSFWTNLLFINNLYPHQFGAQDPDGLGCMSWSWIFAVDIQLFLLVPLLALLYRRMDPSRLLPFWLTIAALTLGSVLAYWFTAWEYSLSAVCETVFQGFEAPAAVLTRAYNKPWTRAVPYLLGVCLAAFLERFRGHDKTLWDATAIVPFVENPATRKALAYTILVLAFMAHFASIFLPVTAFIASGPDQGQCAWDRAANACFIAFRHCLYGLSLLVIATVCTLNCGGWIGWVARRPFWIPLGRVAYCVYMFTPIILIVTIFSSPFRSSFATTTQASACVSNGFFGVVFGSVLYFLVDRPAKNLMLLVTREDH